MNQSGHLPVGDGNEIYWETCGNPDGKPAVVLHGGPGSGCSDWPKSPFDLELYHLVLFDQRNCGRSRPHASHFETDLTYNKTSHLVEDIEKLGQHLNIEKWLVFGGSWGSVLALAYATEYPQSVTELILFGVAIGRQDELDWLFRGGLSILFPEEWARLKAFIPANMQSWDVVEAYDHLLNQEDPEIRAAAAYEWCLWESATPNWPPTTELSGRFTDPSYRMAFARIVTHFVKHNLWMPEDGLTEKLVNIQHIPGVIVNGKLDLQSPFRNAWLLHNLWPASELVAVENAGHSVSERIAEELKKAAKQFSHKP